MTIVIPRHDIAAVGRAKQVRIPPSAKVIDSTGKFVIPGLWGMHTHFRDAARDLKMDVANGVLGTRTMGGVAREVFPLRDAIARGQQLGPKIVACGPIIDGPDSWSNPEFTISVKTADEARAAVVSLKQQGTDCSRCTTGCREIRTTPLSMKQWLYEKIDGAGSKLRHCRRIVAGDDRCGCQG